MFGSLIKSNYPKAAIGFGNGTVSALMLQRAGRGRFGIRRAATSEIPPGTLNSSFYESNIPDIDAMVNLLESVVLDAGLASEKKWSVALPSNSARTAIITLDEVPASKAELSDVLDWKTETAFGVDAGELRVSRRKLSPGFDGKTRYFTTGVKLVILDEYESVFTALGWNSGLMLPRAISESNWISGRTGDSLLISAQNDGFTALLMRDREPVVVRSVTCQESELDDEIYRLLVYYQDRVAHEGGEGRLARLLVLGEGLTTERIDDITAEAMGEALRIVRPDDLGFDIPSGGLNFEDLAAPAGLATLAWN